MYYLCSENKDTDHLLGKISCMVSAQLICAFVFAYAKSMFSHDVAQFWFALP